MRPFAIALALSVCLTLLLVSGAQSSNWLDIHQGLDAGQAKPVIQIMNEKQQREKNKECGPGKVFVKNQGCVKREKAEKMKEKEKEKSKPAPPPPPPVKTDCQVLGPNQGAAGGAADPKMKYECEPLGGGNKRCCWVKYP
jgi:hypothetical protein